MKIFIAIVILLAAAASHASIKANCDKKVEMESKAWQMQTACIQSLDASKLTPTENVMKIMDCIKKASDTLVK